MLLAAAARRMGIAGKLAAVIPDGRDPTRVVHPLPEILLARVLAIACGYADADDLDRLRADPAFKLACGRLPESGADLMSQPTVSRWENAPGLRDLLRLGRVLVELYCASYAAPPAAVVLDIDDTLDVVHGRQQLSLFNAHHDERCFLPIHVYDTATARPVAVILRPGKTPSGKEVRGHLRRLVRAIRRRWPATGITIRGDGHYGRPEVMDFCEANGVDYVFGLTGTKALADKLEDVADAIRVERAVEDQDAVRGFAETTHRAGSWARERRVAARIEATRLGLDIRYVVTNIATGTAEWLYAELYCQRGQAENLIKRSSPRTAPAAGPRPPTRCGSSCTPPPTGSSSPSARRSPRRTRSPWPSLRPSGCGCSRSRPASPRARAVSASLSPPPARTPPCSARLPPNSGPRRAEHRGRAAPTRPSRPSNACPTTDHAAATTRQAEP